MLKHGYQVLGQIKIFCLCLIFAIPKHSGLLWREWFNQVFRISWLQPVSEEFNSAIVKRGHSSVTAQLL